MAVKKAKEASFKKMDSAFATSQSAIQKVKNTDPLNGNEEQEQGNENVSIDPAHYLSKKEKKEWKRLSYTAKQRYIRQAERQLKRQKKRNGIARTEQSSVQEKEKQAAKIFSKERKYRSNTWKEPVDKKEIGSHGGNGEIASKSRDSRAAIRSQSTVAGGEKAADIASPSVSDKLEMMTAARMVAHPITMRSVITSCRMMIEKIVPNTDSIESTIAAFVSSTYFWHAVWSR